MRTNAKMLAVVIFVLILPNPLSDSIAHSKIASTHPDSGSSRGMPTVHWDPAAQFSDRSIGQASLVATTDVTSLGRRETASESTVAAFRLPSQTRSDGSSAAVTNSISGATILGSVSSSSISLFARFDGITQNQAGDGAPPDVQVAAGPSNLVEMTNTVASVMIGIFSKQGSLIKMFTFGQFSNNASFVSDNFFDPKLLFDAPSGRWFASVSDGTANKLIIVVSATSDPMGTWKIYSLGVKGDFPDQPIIGVSDDKFVITADGYATTGPFIVGPFIGAQLWVLDKSEMVAGLARVDFSSFGPINTLESIHPVKSLSPTADIYMVTTGGADIQSRDFHFFTVAGTPRGTVTVQTIPLSISPITPSVNATQLGGSAPVIDTGQFAGGPGDARVQDAVWFQGKLWFTFNDGCTPAGDNQTRSCFRLTQIVTSLPIVVTQDFDVSARGLHYFYPALSVDSSGNLAVVFGYSSTTNSTCCFPSLAVTGQAVNDPNNSFRMPQTLVSGSVPDSVDAPCADFRNCMIVRYGDYFGAGLDPSDSTLVWVAGQYEASTLTCTRLATFVGACWSAFISSMRVVGLGYSISASPIYQNVVASSSNSSTIGTNSLGGFAGIVSLTASVSPPGPVASLNSTSFTLVAGGSGRSRLTVSSAGLNAAGAYTVTVTATSGSMKITATLYFLVVGFDISASPRSLGFSGLSSGTTTITIVSINNFAGSVSLGATISPDVGKRPTLSLNSTTVTISKGGSAGVTLTVSSRRSTLTGLYNVIVTGTGSSQTHTVLVSVAITPLSTAFSSVSNFTGVTVKTMGTVSIDSPSTALTFSGTARVVATNTTTGGAIFTDTYTITKIPLQSVSAGSFRTEFLMDVAVYPFALASVITITLLGPSPKDAGGLSDSLFVTRNPDITLDGIVRQADLDIVLASLNCRMQQSCYNPRADLDADGVVDGIDISIVSAAFAAPDFLPNFSITANNGSLGFAVGSSATSTLTLSSANGFAGTVNLALSISPAVLTTSIGGLSATPSPASITLAAGGTSAPILTVSSTRVGDFAVNVTGISGLLLRSAIVTVHVTDFGIFASPTSLMLAAGSSAHDTVSLTSINGLAGTVGLNATVSPIVSNGPSISFSLSTIALSPGGFGTSSMTISAVNVPPGTYTVRVTGTVGSLSRTIIVTVAVTA